MDKYLAKARNLAARFGAEDQIEKEALKKIKSLTKKPNVQNIGSKQHKTRSR